MSDLLHPVSFSLVRAALDATQLRHQVIVNNIANANTPGYVTQRVSFEGQLDALRATLRAGGTVEADMFRNALPTVQADPSRSAVALDIETAALAENTVRYEALLKALGKQMSIISIAVNQGKK